MFCQCFFIGPPGRPDTSFLRAVDLEIFEHCLQHLPEIGLLPGVYLLPLLRGKGAAVVIGDGPEGRAGTGEVARRDGAGYHDWVPGVDLLVHLLRRQSRRSS